MAGRLNLLWTAVATAHSHRRIAGLVPARAHPEALALRIGFEEWRPESDVDLLVEFLPGQEPDLLGLLDLQDDLEVLLGRPVDLVPQAAVTNPFRRKRIWDTRREIYAA